MNFEIGKSYNDGKGNTFTMLSREKDFGVFRFNCIERKYRIVKYCGVESLIQFGNIILKACPIHHQFDPEFDLPKEPVIYKLNTNNERYIDVFKSHVEKE